ncbi:alpha/beta hydrolase [Lapidilactobacillus achengensis]|uniref:Alpha/beta hydrolase n=1 Tax=Lapidilactobacillus achengensis TaxID=2486000 RepID=A0ABW1UNH4_9LACO|nr:alpha/beta hydrolase [Lapidilactobacillus achengensis]
MKTNKNTTKAWAHFACGVATGLVGVGVALGQRRRLKSRYQTEQYAKAQQPGHGLTAQDRARTDQVPTIYVHGFRGGDYTTNKMVLSAQNATDADTYLKVIVDWRGDLTYEGHWSTDPYPLIQIVFKDKWMPVLQIVNWLNLVLPKLKAQFGFSEYNAVGHSIGATALVRVEMRNYDNAAFPKLNKLVLVAGVFDGVVALGDWPNVNRLNHEGRPVIMNPHYLQLLLGRHRFPANVSVLNIYGNIGDTSNTDKYISVISAKSIRYILAPIAKTFKEVEVFGKDAEHSKLHDDERVLAVINRFLFNHNH